MWGNSPVRFLGEGWRQRHSLTRPRRKGHRYDTILCDLDGRHVLEVSAGRKTDDVTRVLERLTDCDAVEAVSMDMSRAFREAVQLCLPRA